MAKKPAPASRTPADKGSADVPFSHRHGPQTDPTHDLSDSHQHSHVGPPPRALPEGTMKLSELSPDSYGIVVNVGGEGALRRRLLDMGLTPGTRILFRKTAPMGDPLELSLRGYSLSIRKEDAGRILVLPERDMRHDGQKGGRT